MALGIGESWGQTIYIRAFGRPWGSQAYLKAEGFQDLQGSKLSLGQFSLYVLGCRVDQLDFTFMETGSG